MRFSASLRARGGPPPARRAPPAGPPPPAAAPRPPYDVFVRALEGGSFEEVEALGSMRVLRRVSGDAGDVLV